MAEEKDMEQVTTRLHYAAHDGDCQRIETELQGEGIRDLEAKDKYGRTPLLRAAYSGHVDAFELLLRNKTNFNASDGYGRNPTHLAAKKGQLNVLRRIMDFVDAYKQNPSDVAFLNMSTEYDINAGDDWGRTPLHLAYLKGMIECAEFLEERGADQNCTDIDGKTPDELAD